MTASTLYELYRQHAQTQGDAVAVQGLNAVGLTYRGLIVQTERISAALAAWGIGRGDRVIVQLPNGPEALVTMHGVAAAVLALLIDPRADAAEADYFARFTEPKAVLVQQGSESSARDAAQRHGIRVIEIIPTPAAGAGSFDFAEVPPPLTGAPPLNGPDDLAFMVSTSGTTALPRIVPRTQNGMLRAVEIPRTIQLRATGRKTPMRALNAVPMHLFFGTLVSSAALASGGSVACMPGLEPDQFYGWLERYRPDFLYGPPPFLEQLLALADQYPEILARHEIKHINFSSAPLSEPFRVELNRILGAPIAQTYAMTEVECISQWILDPNDARLLTTHGRVERAEATGVMAADGSLLPAGQVGEIVVKPLTFDGYWNNPEANAEAFVDGWFRTGDEGLIDADGNLTLVGRLKEVINNGGAKVSPYEVEAVLRQHPQVQDVAVFGFRQADVGEAVAAVVVGTASERELRKFAAEHLLFFKVPTRILLVDAIPVTASGKVLRNRLAEILGLE